MKESTAYYKIIDLNIVAKEENHIPYLYDKKKGWLVDQNHILSDRLIGYDGTEEVGSPYRIGNTDMLSRVDEISEEVAIKLIENM